jgi:hypothetical protein
MLWLDFRSISAYRLKTGRTLRVLPAATVVWNWKGVNAAENHSILMPDGPRMDDIFSQEINHFFHFILDRRK